MLEASVNRLIGAIEPDLVRGVFRDRVEIAFQALSHYSTIQTRRLCRWVLRFQNDEPKVDDRAQDNRTGRVDAN